jgi:hypothetical protein
LYAKLPETAYCQVVSSDVFAGFSSEAIPRVETKTLVFAFLQKSYERQKRRNLAFDENRKKGIFVSP